MKTNQKFNPSNIQNTYTGSEDNDLENLPFKDQVKLHYKSNPFKERDKSFLAEKEQQEIDHKNKDMNMKQQWSVLLSIYLIIFTYLMFKTLWCNQNHYHLDKITLNFLIIFGFAKVVGVVWLIVSHLFPHKYRKKSFAN